MPSIRQRFHLSPCSDFRSHFLPTRSNNALTDAEIVLQNLTKLGGILKLKADDVPRTFFEFCVALAGTTHHMKSRSQRFITFYKALLPELL